MTRITSLRAVNDALAGLVDREQPVTDRAAFFALLHQVQLRINRVLRQAKKEGLVEELVRDYPDGIGPISIKWEPFDVEWPCNDEGNWEDDSVQGAMEVYSKVAPEYFRLVPEHWEIDTAALGEAVHLGDPVARTLHTECKDRGWRTEGGRRAAIKVKEAKVPA